MIFVGAAAFGQQNHNFLRPAVSIESAVVAYSHANKISRYPAQSLATPVRPVAAISANQPLLPSNYYASRLGFFCKKEIQLQKATSLNFRFRLGSVQQCDWLEGKQSAKDYRQ